MEEAQKFLATDPALQDSIADFPWSAPSVPQLAGLLIRVTGALNDLVSDEYPSGWAHGTPDQRDDQRYYRYWVPAHDELNSPRSFIVM
jgi:hypothetical protein